MRKIFKYAIPILAEGDVAIPIGAQFLSIQSCPSQEGEVNLYLWALVDPDEKLMNCSFRIYGTGYLISDCTIGGFSYIATVQNRGYVWHVWFKF